MDQNNDLLLEIISDKPRLIELINDTINQAMQRLQTNICDSEYFSSASEDFATPFHLPEVTKGKIGTNAARYLKIKLILLV